MRETNLCSPLWENQTILFSYKALDSCPFNFGTYMKCTISFTKDKKWQN